MPEPYPNPFSGLATGLQQGFQMGLLQKQQAQAEEQRTKQEAQQNFEQGLKLLELGATYSKIKNPAYRDKGMTFTKQGAEKLGMKMPDQMPAWQDEFGDVANEIEAAIKGFRQFGDRDVLEKGLQSAYQKAGTILEDNELKTLREDTTKRVEGVTAEQESGMLQQAAMIPGLAKQSVLSPEEAQAGQLTALAGAGTKGQEVLATGMKQGDKEPQSTDTVNQLGQAMFGKNWGELSQIEKQKVIDKKFSMDAAIAGARTTATGMANQDIPLDPGELSNLVDPGTFAPMPVGTTPAQAAQRGAVKVNAQQKSDYFDLTKANQSITELFSLADKLITADSPAGAAKQYALLTGGAYTRANPDAKVYTDARLAAMSNISRTLGEKGVLTDFDITRANNAFPNFGDTVAIKNEKRRIMTEMLSVAGKAAKAKLLGVEPEPSDMKKLKDLLNKADKVGKTSGLTTSKPAKSWQELKSQRGY